MLRWFSSSLLLSYDDKSTIEHPRTKMKNLLNTKIHSLFRMNPVKPEEIMDPSKIERYEPIYDMKVKKTLFGKEYIEIIPTGRTTPVFKTIEDQCQFNCQNADNKAQCLSQCLHWEPFNRCLANHAKRLGTGIMQCTFF